MLSIGNTIWVFVINFVIFCNGASDEVLNKNTNVDKIIEKIFKLTSQSLKDANPKEKEEIMEKIEQKLRKSAQPLGSKADKYVQLIMQGLTIMANNLTNTQTDYLTLRNLRKYNNNTRVNDDSITKGKAQELASKILKLAEKYFNKPEQSSKDKLKIIKSIKDRVLETAKQRHDLIHVKHSEIKKYTDLISRGMELMIKNMSGESHHKRRMVMEFLGKKQNDLDEYGSVNFERSKNNINYLRDSTFPPTASTTTTSYEGLTSPISCDDVFHQTCADIKSLNDFICRDDGVTLPLRYLCNGVTDCTDGSDEGNCLNQATDRLQSAADLMTRIENFLLRNCFLASDNSLLIKQNTVLYDVLKRQIGFINKYKNMNNNALELSNAYSFKRTLNEVIMVIDTLAVALDSSLCIRFMNEMKAEENARKFNLLDADDLDGLTEKPVRKVNLKSCVCSGSVCANATCPEACMRVCWYKYTIGRWTCQAVDDGTSVPLDMVCDGKLDCLDESDETDCKTGVSQAKFEANDAFEHALKIITKKSSMNEYSIVKSKLITLGNSILQLQRMVVMPKFDIQQIKNIRDKFYASLISIYEDIVSKSAGVEALEEPHMFLLSVGEKLMSALKLSHTGNERIMTTDGCHCRRDRCAALACSPKCKRACAVTPKLTRYWCKATVNNNVSVPISAICNGERNCPFEDDELQCSYDICRKHHLLLLRHNIRDVGEKHKGTALGEALRSWKTKVESTIKVAENNYRPTPSSLRELVGDMLHDLVMAYGSIDDTRRANGSFTLKEFYDISQRVIEGLKSCGK